ncbi:hypothetical protein ACLKMY_30395 [Paraburkholderia mimosarum]|uniref:hypothetical protein n=1 Tax=Paraburkholderia mimosarum TaxID=312026 RepID=UPI0039C3295F
MLLPKEWLFAASPRGAKAAARMYTLLVTAGLNHVAPLCWLKTTLGRFPPYPAGRVHELLRLPVNALRFMDILDRLRQAPSAELYRLYVAIGKMLDDPRRILEVRQQLHLGMSVDYVGDNPLEPLSQGTIVELRHTQAVVQDGRSRRHWAIPYAAIIPGRAAPVVQPEPPPSPRSKPEEFVIGDTVGFTDKHLNERFGIIVRLNTKTASIAVTGSEGHWRVSYGLLRKIVDV